MHDCALAAWNATRVARSGWGSSSAAHRPVSGRPASEESGLSRGRGRAAASAAAVSSSPWS